MSGATRWARTSGASCCPSCAKARLTSRPSRRAGGVSPPPPPPPPPAPAQATATTPAAISPAAQQPQPGTEDLPPTQAGLADASCQVLNPEELSGRTVNILYEVEPGRRFRLTDIDITGTDALTYEDVAQDLRSQERNVLDF